MSNRPAAGKRSHTIDLTEDYWVRSAPILSAQGFSRARAADALYAYVCGEDVELPRPPRVRREPPAPQPPASIVEKCTRKAVTALCRSDTMWTTYGDVIYGKTKGDVAQFAYVAGKWLGDETNLAGDTIRCVDWHEVYAVFANVR